MRRSRIIAVKTSEANLRPGDLYSEKGPEFWNRVMSGHVQGQISVVTNDFESHAADVFVFRLTIVTENEEGRVDRNQYLMAEGFDPHTPPGVQEWELGRVK